MTIKYVGNGTFIHGVPARDLSEAEYKTHKKAIKAAEKAANVVLYEVIEGTASEQTEGEQK
jgi:hypothetical protein